MINPNRTIRRSLLVLGLLGGNLVASIASAAEYDLSREDVAFIQQIARRDDFTRNMIGSDLGAGIGALRQILAIIPAMPTKLVMQWDQAMIRPWRRANNALDRLNKAEICDAITEYTDHTKNVPFFFQLYEARGCAD
jgi:hypothetical protein